MFESFSRSWQLTKLTFGIINQDKEMLLFPFLGVIFSVIFMLALLFPTIIVKLLNEVSQTFGILEYVLLFLTYLGLAFIATFFNVAVVYTVKTRIEGGNATFMDSIKFSFSKIHLIFMWSIVSATVGLILKFIDNLARRQKGIGRIILQITRSLLGMAWGIVTIFVVPGMVYYGLNPIDAIKRSVSTIRKTWGESLIRYFGFGAAQALIMVIGLITLSILFLILLTIGGIIGALIGFLLIFLFVIVVVLTFNVAKQVFNTALFVYSETGKVPLGIDPDIMRNAFKNQGLT